MFEKDFERRVTASFRTAAVRASNIVASYRLPAELRRDFAQEAILQLWRMRRAYDPSRGSRGTFGEKAIANRLRSSLRVLRREPAGPFFALTIQILNSTAKPGGNLDLEFSIAQVLGRVAKFDRDVAESLMECSAVDTAARLSVSRATVYRAIERLRFAFIDAGFGERRKVSTSERKPAAGRGRLQ